MDSQDVFPLTLNTWIGRRLESGTSGAAEVNQYLMEVYSWPLQVYFRGTADRWLGEAEDIVQGFFADRLARKDFLHDWQKSGLRLRRWLMNGFCFFLKELRRDRRKASREKAMVEDHEDDQENVDQQIDRVFAVSIVQQALHQSRELCETMKLMDHWSIFYRHYYEGLSYQEIVKGLDINTVRAATMCRTVAGKFRSSLRDLLARDGAKESEINRELECLLEAVGE